MIKNFKNLTIWQCSRGFVKTIYLARDLEFISKDDARILVTEVVEIRRMKVGFQKTL